MNQNKWDEYFRGICCAVASKSPCLSRQIGAILVHDYSIVSTGYNGPPRGIPHCGLERFKEDSYLQENLELKSTREEISKICPRRLMGFPSGEGMQWCPAQHAEENAVSNAARNGVSVRDCVLYMNSVIPCQKCFGTLINAGVVALVVDEITTYDKHTEFLMNNSYIRIRQFFS